MHYDMRGDKDSAFIYYKHALEALPDSDNIVYRNIMSHLTLLSYYSRVVSVEESINVFKGIVCQTYDEAEKLSRLLCVGCIYYNER